jgi:hypothetical protein
MENEKDLSDSESDLEEDIVFGKLFDFSRDWVFIVLTVLIMKIFDILLWKQ